ncbi:mucin-2-like [Argopecten irradians]|uniref:mucin-2-like n=1 Tax=Argopecten irradians TaxID=31199 RepID=UPI003720524D
MTLCSCSMIYAQRHSFQKQNFRRIQSNGFNSQPSTSEGQAFRKSSMMISDPSNAFNFRQNSRRELELNNMNNFHNRQTERRQTIRNRPVNSNQEKGKNISPSFSMPVLPDIQKQRRINKSNRNFVPTTTLAPVLKVESAVVSKPYMVPGWVGSQNGQPTRPWQRNGRNSKSRADGRTDEYIYMVNGHPARKGNFLNDQDPQNQQQNTNFNNGKRSSMNSLPLNGNNLNKNNEQFQNSNYKKNTVHPLFQHTINSRRFGGMNMGDGGANRQTAGVTGGVPNSGSLSNSQWGEGTLGSPGNLMTLTPNENGIGMNRIHTTAASDNYLPSTVSVRLPKNGHLLPSVMPQLSPTRRAEPPLSHSRHQTVISSGMAPIPQTRQYVDSPIAVKKIPIPSPQPAEISVQPIESFHISTRRVQQGNSRPTSMKVGPPTSGFNHAPFPSYSINNQEVNPSSMPGLTQTTKSNARINVQRRPMDHPGLAIDMMVPGVEYMEPRQTRPRPTVGQQIGPLPSPLPRQHIGPKAFNGQQRRHRGPMPTIRHDTGPHPTNGQHMSPQTPMVEYIRPRPTPTQGPRPTIGNQIRTHQPPSPNFGPRPMTGRHKGPHPTPSQNMGPRSTTAQHVRPITPDVGMKFIQPSVQPIMQRPVPSQSTRPIKSSRQPIGDIPQLSRSMHGSISPQQTQSEIHMIQNQPSMPLLGKMPGTPIPEKVLRNQQMLPLQQHPRAPLMGVMPSAKPLREKINWQMHSPLPANGHGQVSHPWSTTRTHSVGPIYSSISQNGPNLGMNVRPTRIAPSQGPMPQDWSQSSSTSLILPSARPTKSTSGLVNGQVISHSTDEPIPIIETTSNDIIKLTTYDNVADKTSDYISMTWLPQNNPGVSPSIDQASKGHVTVSKPRVDDDNGNHKNSKYKNGMENGKNGMENGKNGMENGDNGYYETKPTTGSRKDVPVTKTTVKVSPSQPVRRVYVKLQDGKDNHQRMNNVSKTTPATPKYSSSSDPKGTISSLDMFLIQTSGQIGPESPPTETKTMSTTNMITNNKPKPKKVTKEKTVLEPVIPSTKTSGKQSMRIFDINAFSIIRSQFLPKTDVKTTAQTPKRPSSTASLQELTKRLPVVSKSVVGSTQASLRSSVRNVDTRTDSMLKSATTTEPTTTTKRTIIFRNRNIIPPALQEIMDALKRPYYQAGVPINLNQVYAPEATETPEIQKTRKTNVGGFDIGNINGNIQGNPDLISPATTNKKSVITPPPTQPTPPPTTTTIATTTRPLTTTRATTTTTKPTTTMVVSTTETIPGMSSEKQMSFKSMKTSFVNPNIQSHQNYSYNSPTAGFISEQSTQQPFFDAKKEVSQNLFIQPSAEPTSDTDQTSTVSEQSKTSIFFGMWSPTPQNDSTTGDTHNSQPTSASTSGDHTSDNGIPYPTLSQDHLTPTDAVPWTCIYLWLG